jgi:hypothetical protein
VNTISAGPYASRAASAIGIIEAMVEYAKLNSPLPEELAAEDVGNTAAFLASPLAAGITGTTIYVDKGSGYYGTEIHWAAAKGFSYIRGCLFGSCNGGVSLRGTGTFTGTIDKCVASPAAGDSVIDSGVGDPSPITGNNYFYLVRGRSATCGATAPGYTSNELSEDAGRDAAIDADGVAGTCP